MRHNFAGRIVFVRHDAFHARLEVRKERKPDASSRRVSLHQGLIIGQGVVIQKQPARYVKRDEHVDGIVLVRGQNEKDPEHVHHPRESVQIIYVSRSI